MPVSRKSLRTPSLRRFAYTSFKGHLDAVRIAPSRKLTRTAADDAEELHFLAQLQHWQEVNISADFTAFVREVEPFSGLLVQVIHHQQSVFDALAAHLEHEDVHSVQPLLDLTAQFARDLGPDFMAHLPRVLALVSTLVLSLEATTVQYAFTMLAQVFRYLGRELVLPAQLVAMFTALEPMLRRTTKKHVARFAAEALAYLVRRAAAPALAQLVERSFTDLTPEYCTALALVYAEAVCNTEGSFHSKAVGVVSAVLQQALSSENTAAVSVALEMVRIVAGHGNKDTMGGIEAAVLEACTGSAAGTAVLVALVFSDSGRSVADWPRVVASVETAIPRSDPLIAGLLVLVVFRNAPEDVLVRSHVRLLRAVQQFAPEPFFRFVASVHGVAPERLVRYATGAVQTYIDTTGGCAEVGAYLTAPATAVTVLPQMAAACMQGPAESLKWRLQILAHAHAVPPLTWLDETHDLPDGDEIEGLVFQAAAAAGDPAPALARAWERLPRRLHSNRFLAGVLALVRKSGAVTGPEGAAVTATVTQGLATAPHETRAALLELLEAVHPSSRIHQCLLLEQTPLALSTARDVVLRARQLGQAMAGAEAVEVEAAVGTLFGMLTNHFAPSWEAAVAVLQGVVEAGGEARVWDEVESMLAASEGKSEGEGDADTGDAAEESAEESTEEAAESDAEMADAAPTAALWLDSRILGAYHAYTAPRHSEPSLPSPVDPIAQALRVLAGSSPLLTAHADALTPYLSSPWSSANQHKLLGLLASVPVAKLPLADALYARALVLLASRTAATQRAALALVAAFKRPAVNATKERLNLLLESSTFRDQLSAMALPDASVRLPAVHEAAVVPLATRILYGRAQDVAVRGAVVEALPALGPAWVAEFVQLAMAGVDGSGNHRKLAGFSTMGLAIVKALGVSSPAALETLVDPAIAAVAAAEDAPRTTRTQALRLLAGLFEKLPADTWKGRHAAVYAALAPRMAHFVDENLQQPGVLVQMVAQWGRDCWEMLAVEDFAAARAMCALAAHTGAKESVVQCGVEFFRGVLAGRASRVSLDAEEPRIELLALVVAACLEALPGIVSRAADPGPPLALLLELTGKGYVTRGQELVAALAAALDRGRDRPAVLAALVPVVAADDVAAADVRPVYEACSRLVGSAGDAPTRKALGAAFTALGRFAEYSRVSLFASGLLSQQRLGAADYAAQVEALRTAAATSYEPHEWPAVLHGSLKAMGDEERGVRAAATAVVMHFFDLGDALKMLQLVVLPGVRKGLRSKDDGLFTASCEAMEHATRTVDGLQGLQVLAFGDEEASFYPNVCHVQVHRRVRALARLAKCVADGASELSPTLLSRYVLPVVERLVVHSETSHEVLAQAVATVLALSAQLPWGDYRKVLMRYASSLSTTTSLKLTVAVIVAVVLGAPASAGAASWDLLAAQLLPLLSTSLAIRDDETAPFRVPLVVASAAAAIRTSDPATALPPVLTSACQMMRSRAESLRDAVRKALGQTAVHLGPEYLPFLLRELGGALTRGSQIHVLGYTVHHLVEAVCELGVADNALDTLAQLVTATVMEDLFGSAASEKDADGYTTKMKEVRHHKSMATGELLAGHILLGVFGELLVPVERLLGERLDLKAQRRVEELLKRYAAGLLRAGGREDLLLLVNELLRRAMPTVAAAAPVSASASHFLVNLSRRTAVASFPTTFTPTLQSFALELLRGCIQRAPQLAPAAMGLSATLLELLESLDESVTVSCMRLLATLVRSGEGSEEVYAACARHTLATLRDSPATGLELAQAAIRLLTSLLRHGPAELLKQSQMSYVLLRLLPDLSEPQRQAPAFAFLRAVMARGSPLPEVYTSADAASELVVTSHSREVRDMARAAYLQFLLEYPHGKAKMEARLQALLANLQYPAADGRESALELVSQFVARCSPELAARLAPSVFVGVAVVLGSDGSGRCREMAREVLGAVLTRAGDGLVPIELCMVSWLGAGGDKAVVGAKAYQALVDELGVGVCAEADAAGKAYVSRVLNNAGAEAAEEVSWNEVHTAVTLFGHVVKANGQADHSVWQLVSLALLYPHPWVRLAAARVVGPSIETSLWSDEESVALARRLLRQLGAKVLDDELAGQTVRSLAGLVRRWDGSDVVHDETPAGVWAVGRVAAIVRGDNTEEAKKAGVRFLATVPSVVSSTEAVAFPVLRALNTLVEGEESELRDLAIESLGVWEGRLGKEEYARVYTEVKVEVGKVRVERRAKRAALAVTAPEASARRKLRKHERFREKRKERGKDENGFYKGKKKRAV